MQPLNLAIKIGPFHFSISTSSSLVKEELALMYDGYPKLEPDEIIDFSVSVSPASGLRKYVKPQAVFKLDSIEPFKPMPLAQAYPMLEWGMNWSIANYAHQYLMLHSAILEKNNKSIIFPAPGGSGKSTLCAALTFNDWRLFSDEIALINTEDKLAYPITRPISLKNESIDIIRAYQNNARFSQVAHDTHKGDVALLKPLQDSIDKMHIPAPVHYLVFPKYKKGAKASLFSLEKTETFSMLISNCFNYHSIGLAGFDTMHHIIDNARCYMFEYSEFDEANQVLSQLVLEN